MSSSSFSRTTPTRTGPQSSSSLQSPRRRPRPAPLVFESPRCHQKDEDDATTTLPSLKQHDDRWKHMSRLAGDHQQDPTVLDLSCRPFLSPPALRVGVPPQVASRIVELHLPCIGGASGQNLLPEWLDAIASMFFQLQRLRFASDCHGSSNSSPVDAEAARMRRLYILYRLPGLESIDGKPVTPLERELARPSSPSGFRVNRDDWVPESPGMADDDEDDEDGSSSNDDDVSSDESEILHGDAVEVGLYGAIRLVDADPPKEEEEERQLLVEMMIEEATPGKNNSTSSTFSGIAESILSESELEPFPSCLGRPMMHVDETDTTVADLGDDPRQDAVNHFVEVMNRSRSASPKERKSRMGNPQDMSPPTAVATTMDLSLLAPYPIQSRSKSFNSTYAVRKRSLLSMHRSPSSEGLDGDLAKATIEQDALPTSLSSPHSIARSFLSKAHRPPPAPGSRRLISSPTPAKTEPRKSKRAHGRWRAKLKVRNTSIVDNIDDDTSSDEEVLVLAA